MAGGFHGADVAQLRQLAATMRSAGRMLDGQRLAFNAGVVGTPWPGPDAERFRQDWKGSHSRSMGAAALFLDQAADALLRQANEQDSASSAAGGSAVSGPSGGSSGTPGPGDVAGKSASEVRDWWLSLTDAQHQDFIRDHPGLAGNTNGIPFNARVEANRLNAQERIVWLETKDPEPEFNPWNVDSTYPLRFAAEHETWRERQSGLEYLQQAVAGKIQLAAYDPDEQSIVELIGNFDEHTTSVITYVPGTTTNEASFYGGGPQQLANRFVEADKSGGTAAFVYKGSEFPDGGFVEAFLVEAKSDEFVADSAPVLRAFQDAVDLELPSGAQSVGMGHSWGLRNLTGAETEGAHFDKLIALSGAAMPPGWEPDPGTDYSSFTYPDILLTAEANGVVGENYPMKEPAFEKHVYEPPGGFGWTEAYSIDNHSLIATTDPWNEKAINDVRTELRDR
ncbi:hypothetical protein JOE31_001666 [Arthrobacter sp. PvP023]|uniref:hypothetical protein n=1 Tax=Micrococcaceae TaxID=1268 RepID=UPI001AE64FE4|nr:hypothetical protein [Arthrobacter sp. PvP023]MBP1135434.1 hypothetical protein [Arthrobacter sp. PvP023]